MRILVIGASGFLGSLLYDEFQKQHYTVAGTYYSQPSSDLTFLDLCDRGSVKELLDHFQPHLVIDCSGMTRPDHCEIERSRAYKVNVNGVDNAISLCRCKYIYFSTDYVFDGLEGQYTEYDIPHPINFYGLTKLEAEKIVLSKKGNVVIRVSGLYGISKRNNEFILSLSQEEIYRSNDCFSSNLLIDDIAKHINYFWDKEGIFHLSDGTALSKAEFMSIAVKYLNLKTKVMAVPSTQLSRAAIRPKNSSIISKRHSLALKGIEQGLSYLKHQLSHLTLH